MSKLDEAELDEFVNTVKAGGTDTIVCVAFTGKGEENVFFCQGTGRRCLAASAVAHHMVAKEAGVGLKGAIKALLALSEDTPMKK